MTPARMTPRMIAKAGIAFAALLGLAGSAAAAGEPSQIPTRVRVQDGRLVLSQNMDIAIYEVSAGKWARRQVVLRKDGQSVWDSPLLDFLITPETPYIKETKLARVDLDGNGKPDWLYLSMSRHWGSYNGGSESNRTWPDDEAQRKLFAEPWAQSLCSAPSGLIVLDDEKTAYAFNYNGEPDPFAHSNPYVQGPIHFKRVADGSYERAPYRLQTSSVVPEKILKALRALLDAHSCSTPSVIRDGQPLDPAYRFNWQAKQQPFGTPQWRDNLAEGLAMYRRAQEVYAQRRQSMPKDELLTQNGLSVFRLDHFFETFAYDEIDPENKFADYTAMLNDYAFYLMAPQDAAEAVGFDQRRKPVDEGVLAMLAHVIRRDPKRAVAYLNLGDALWRSQRDAEAAWYYKQYVELLKAANPKAKPPQRTLDRAKAG